MSKSSLNKPSSNCPSHRCLQLLSSSSGSAMLHGSTRGFLVISPALAWIPQLPRIPPQPSDLSAPPWLNTLLALPWTPSSLWLHLGASSSPPQIYLSAAALRPFTPVAPTGSTFPSVPPLSLPAPSQPWSAMPTPWLRD